MSNNIIHLHPRARNDRVSLSQISPAVWHQAWALAADPVWIQRIAAACCATAAEVTGPAADAVAKVLARGNDPRVHERLVIAACRRELAPSGPLCDPHTIPEALEAIVALPSMPPKELDYLPDARRSPRTWRRRAATRRQAVRVGQMDLLLI